MTNKTALYRLLADLEAYLESHRADGVERVEISPETLAALKAAADSRPAPPPSSAEDTPRDALPVDRLPSLEAIAERIAQCRACDLHKNRNKVVPGEGNPDRPDIMFVGEGPGADEDRQGRPFVGRAGQLLTKMIEAMGYRREEVFIANIVKCRPPGNRQPKPDEMRACLPYLERQIDLIRPKVIIALGATALRGLLGRTGGIMRLRGLWQEYRGIPLMPTFHPAYLLRDPSKKRLVWNDLKLVLEKLGRQPPQKKSEKK